ncbi:MAG: hypothetical protein PHT36_02460 [Patescibacteria group bacterium]|nr:hypothetical protein [Patescibacteria group bacterium]
MILKIFTKGDGPETREARALGQKFEERNFKVEYYDSEDEICINQLEIYDLYSFPSFIVARDDGSELECWRGIVPIFDDILGFLDR